MAGSATALLFYLQLSHRNFLRSFSPAPVGAGVNLGELGPQEKDLGSTCLYFA